MFSKAIPRVDIVRSLDEVAKVLKAPRLTEPERDFYLSYQSKLRAHAEKYHNYIDPNMEQAETTMNKKQLVRYIKDQKIEFVATGDNVEQAFNNAITVATQGGNAAAAIMHYHNTLLQAIADVAEAVEAVEPALDVD